MVLARGWMIHIIEWEVCRKAFYSLSERFPILPLFIEAVWTIPWTSASERREGPLSYYGRSKSVKESQSRDLRLAGIHGFGIPCSLTFIPPFRSKGKSQLGRKWKFHKSVQPTGRSREGISWLCLFLSAAWAIEIGERDESSSFFSF